MTKFDIKKIKEGAEKDYEKTWLETANLLRKQGKFFNLIDKRKEHAVFKLIEKIRNIFLDLGFTEVIVPSIVEDAEVQKQYGPEAPVILDRVFYLAGLPRPDIGIDKRKLQQLKKIGNFDIEKLKEIFRSYKKNEIESDDLVEEMIKRLNIKEEQTTAILNAFPEFKKLKPISTNLTLRSHTTSLWFGVLNEMQKREPLPLQLFSIGQKFRREQKLDPTHLYESWTASIVVMTEEMSLEDGQQIVKEILKKLGFKEVEFVIKKGTSKYYAPQTEFEAFVKHPKIGNLIEIGDGGFYSPVGLANYNITYPVFNFGMGVERTAMILTGEEDIRKLVYPYQYKKVEFSDFEIANSIKPIKQPISGEGEVLVGLIIKTAIEHADDPTPIKVIAYNGKFLGKQIEVKIVKNEAGMKLLGPAALNPIIAKDKNIIGVIPSKIPENATRTDFNYIKGIANLTVAEIEKAIEENRKEVLIEVKDVKSLGDINLQTEEVVRNYIESNNKKIDVRGPAFVWISTKIL